MKYKGNIQVEGNLKIPNVSSSKALTVDASNNIVPSITTDAELAFLSGTTSSVQTQIDAKIPLTQKGANNGVATLDAGGKIPTAQLPSAVMTFEGVWNASTNTPTLVDGTGDPGMVYLVTVAGTQNLGSGSQTFAVGDWVVANSSTVWQKSINSNAVVSVNGQTGVVVLTKSDVGLSNVDNTSDVNKPVSTAQQTALNLKLDLAGGTMTGDINMNGTHRISNLAAPSVLTDAANKGYVDTATAPIANLALKDLSNLTSTAINQDLLPSASLAHSLGSPTVLWMDSFIDSMTTNAIGSAGVGLSINAAGLLDLSGATAISAGNVNIVNVATPTASTEAANMGYVDGKFNTGDIFPTSFTGANNQASPANVTGLAFNAATVRAFEAQISVAVNATASLYEEFTLSGVNIGTGFNISVRSVGNSGVTFSITSAGQVQYMSSNYAGFVSLTIKFRALTTSV